MEPIDGVLIEGVDFVGKTTVARRLTQLVNELARPASLGRCYVQPSPLTAFLENEAAKYDDMRTRDYYYSAALVADLSMLTPPDDYRVQDRHWLTQVGRNAFFYPGEQMMPGEYVFEAHRPFGHNVLLTSTAATKAQRAERRAATSPRDRFLRANPGLHQDYESFLRTLLPAEEDWLMLDTTDCSVEEVSRQILRYCGLLDQAAVAS